MLVEVKVKEEMGPARNVRVDAESDVTLQYLALYCNRSVSDTASIILKKIIAQEAKDPNFATWRTTAKLPTPKRTKQKKAAGA